MEYAGAEDATLLIASRRPRSPSRTASSFRATVPPLLRERRMSLRALARAVDVDVAHLSRTLRAGARPPTAALAERVAVALNLPPCYFPESRYGTVCARLADDPDLLDWVYDALVGDRRV